LRPELALLSAASAQAVMDDQDECDRKRLMTKD
jgi:hypothetical protein